VTASGFDTFGHLLRRLRVAASLTQEALATRCRLSPDTIAALEQGQRRAPRLSTVRAIADALGLSAVDTAELARAAAPERLASGSRMAAASPGDTGDVREQSPSSGARTHKGPEDRRARLPAPIGPLFGRHADIDSVVQDLSTDRLVTLLGPGGVGKTRLAIEVAASTVDKFPGGVWFCDLSGLSDAAAAASAVLHALGYIEQPRVPLLDQLVEALPSDGHLLVFDNCEHMLDDAAGLIARLLTRSSSTVLVTSREALAVPGEVRRRVEALPVPQSVPASAQELSAFASVELFVDRATRAEAEFVLNDSDAASVARICRRLDGLPLAIELVAAEAGSRVLGDLADEIDDQIPLSATARGVPDRQATLRASIEWSYRMLAADEQRAFRCLAVFSAPFRKAVFSDVSGALGGASASAAAGQLSHLVQKSLVQMDRRDGRYRVFDTVRAFAAERALDHGELDKIRDAHAAHYTTWLSTLGADDASDAVLDRISEEYANIRSALIWSTAARSPRSADIVSGLGLFWHHRARYEDARSLGDAALEIVVNADPEAWARVVGTIAVTRLLAGDLDFLASVARAEKVVSPDDKLTQGRLRFVVGYRAPFDRQALETAYTLGTAASRSLAAVSAIALANGSTDSHRGQWLQRAGGLTEQLENATALAAYRFAFAESAIEEGRFDQAVTACLPFVRNRSVMPTTRLIGVGRLFLVALHRLDRELAGMVDELSGELAAEWPAGGTWQTASWMSYGGLIRLWHTLLDGQQPAPVDSEGLGRITRMGVTPSVVRMVCLAALDRGVREDPEAVAHDRHRPDPTSLMAASLGAVEAAHRALDGDDQGADACWRTVLSSAATSGWLLLVCDALEGLGCIAARRGDADRAGSLHAAAARRRRQLVYRHRFSFQQAAIDQAREAVGGWGNPVPLGFREAVQLALDG
jgi:predicted ATPase/transcriptional regulator with XRE-family HTH domain